MSTAYEMERDEYIKVYADHLGLSVHWLGKASKAPLARDWTTRAYQSASTLLEQSRAHAEQDYNIGVKTGWMHNPRTAYIVVDIDNSSYEGLPYHSTPLMTSTPKGWHLYYRAKPNQLIKSRNLRNLTSIAIDIKGEGGQVVIGPSIHPSNTPYKTYTLACKDAWLTCSKESGCRPACLATLDPSSIPYYEEHWTEQLIERYPLTSSPYLPSQPSPPSLSVEERAIAYIKKKPPAVAGNGGHQALWNVALTLIKGFDLPVSTARSIIDTHYNPLCDPPWSAKEIEHKLKDATNANVTSNYLNEPSAPKAISSSTSSNDHSSATAPSGPTKKRAPSLVELANHLQYDPRWMGIVRYNELNKTVEFTSPPPWHAEYSSFNTSSSPAITDTDFTRLQCYVEKEFGFSITKDKAMDALMIAAQANSYHPVRTYLTSLTWDNQPRLQTWLYTYMGAHQNDYTTKVGTWCLIQAVARVMRPGCMARAVVIFEGRQGGGKSTAIKTLGGSFYRDTPIMLGTKDAYQSLNGAWLYELAEIDYLNKYEASQIKQFISSPSDWYRATYGRVNEDNPRQCVFFGSTNLQKSEYLNDATGGTRFWPVATGRIDIPLLAAHRDQLWAEALALFLQGHKWWPESEEEQALFKIEQDERMEEDPWDQAITGFLCNPYQPAHIANQISTQGVTIAFVAKHALSVEVKDVSKHMARRIGTLLTKMGWERVRRRGSGERYYIYINAKVYPKHGLL
jgi:predicted P-loop ATPase